MGHFGEVLKLLLWPLAACITMGILHAYSGLHVLRRGVIFVDLALAQMAALGSVVALFLASPTVKLHHDSVPEQNIPLKTVESIVSEGYHPDTASDELERAIHAKVPTPPPNSMGMEDDSHEQSFLSFWPTAFALFGAVVLAFGRLPGQRIPHEAIIGIVYVVAAAMTVLLLSKSPHAHEQMEEMLTGKLLFVDRDEVLHTGVVYAILGVLHIIFFRPFLAISTSSEESEARGMRVRLWDCLFYGMFAILVTRSVAVAGVLVVFTLLIIPGACASALVESFKARMIVAWLISTVVIAIGLAFSALADLPSGSTLVTTFGAALVVCLFIGGAIRRCRTNHGSSIPERS
ncbi:MAG: metal ABC transporter permease [Planctomycetes bacterium]|nr:metal ABC transporter permease [Planctomycetota bacterium]MBI3833236.1 metal ABC transporter permease [Planctomycetota bacterium]